MNSVDYLKFVWCINNVWKFAASWFNGLNKLKRFLKVFREKKALMNVVHVQLNLFFLNLEFFQEPLPYGKLNVFKKENLWVLYDE